MRSKVEIVNIYRTPAAKLIFDRCEEIRKEWPEAMNRCIDIENLLEKNQDKAEEEIRAIEIEFNSWKHEQMGYGESKKALREHITGHIEDEELANIRTLFLKNERQKAIYQTALLCLKRFKILTTENIYVYNAGFYELGAKRLVTFVQKNLQLEDFLSSHLIKELLGYVERLTYRELAEEPVDKICIGNGILDLNTLDILPHFPEVVFFSKNPVEYKESADCPAIRKFLSEVLNPEDIPAIQEIIGYCLYKSYPIHKAFMLVGSGANGKSTFLNLLKAFLGQHNCSSISLHALEDNRFASAQLFGKLANIFADLPSKSLFETGTFKMLTGEDIIPAEKKFKDGFSFRNHAKLIFSCNQMPLTYDDTDAFFRRWKIVNFPNQYTGTNADKHLLQKLTTMEEMSGLLNFAIEGLKRLLENGEFSNSKTIPETREMYIKQSDSVGAFVIDCLLVDPNNFELKKVLYANYSEYCRKNRYPIVAENTFHRRLQVHIQVQDYRPTENGKRIQCWKGIRYNFESVRDVNDVKVNSLLNYTKSQ